LSFLSLYNKTPVPIKYKARNRRFSRLLDEEDYGDVRSLKCVVNETKADKDERRFLFVLDYVPTEDLESQRLLSGDTGDYLSTLLDLAVQRYGGFGPGELFVTNFNLFKTAGHPDDYVKDARREFKRRLRQVIEAIKPDTVVTFGPGPFAALQPKRSDSNPQNWFGVPISTRQGEHEFKLFSTMSLQTIMRGKSNSEYYLGGYVARNLSNALRGKLDGRIPKLDYEPVLIDTISKFKQLMEVIQGAHVVAVDTETSNLNKIKNNLLTIQFAKCTKYAYILPYGHKDSPFTPKELRYISNRLRLYFEGDNDNDYHIYTNAKFDLNVMRSVQAAFGIRYFHNDVYDIQAGEFVLDENMKYMADAIGYGYYNLGNLSVQYGCGAYLNSNFSKKDRATIKDTDLDSDLIEYMSLDVVVPFAIHEAQIKKARRLKYKRFGAVVRHQISDAIHTFSTMENNGVGLDFDYLFYLKTPNSPINKVIKEMTEELMAMPSVEKCNRLLAKKSRAPKKGLFGDAQPRIFSLRKEEHKTMLFFDVLGLAPLDRGKSGKGKLDKKFQDHYSDVPEVKLFTEISKAKKLRNAYVNSFIKQTGKSDDLQHDKRIRPAYNYLKVVTGRSSANDPNLQQIPSRSELGKHIKRLFIARPGYLFLKVDYRVHEVRGWANISQDQALADVFQVGMDVRRAFKEAPSDELALRDKREGDVHILNASYFFSKTIDEMTETLPKAERKALRNAVKGVVFGLIYGMSLDTLAAKLGKPVEFVQELVKKFHERFPNGTKWFDETKKFARENFFVESPLGRRRNLWGYLLPNPDTNRKNRGIHGAMDRRALNSPIQGMSGDFTMSSARQLEHMKWNYYKEKGRLPDIYVCNSVHDSLEIEVSYRDFILALNLIEQALGPAVEKTMIDRFGFEMLSSLEIDIEVGANMRDVEGWNYDEADLVKYLRNSLKFQKDELGYKVGNIDNRLNSILYDHPEEAPEWLKLQREQRTESPLAVNG
jgi:DNA polymerase I-like protein with 3'-5' exonuclease and polymerase domains